MNKISGLILSLLLSAHVLAQQNDSGDGWGNDDDWDSGWETEQQGLQWHGFVEGALGSRLSSSSLSQRQSLADARLRLETSYQWQNLNLSAKGDLAFDGVKDKWLMNFRELAMQTSLGSHFDLKAGRQVLTWGTGDYLFLNDLFPKDWQSFFAGRDDEYLKAPADAVRVSGFWDWANVELAWMPKFEPDTYIDGEYFSFYNPWAGAVIAPDGINAKTPGDDEWALRIYKTIDGVEWALYGYDGYEKSPKSINLDGRPVFAPMWSLGASVRLPVGPGLINLEVSHYQSKDDSDGQNPMISNSQDRLLVGYEFELLTRLTAGFQYYLEHTQDYAALQANSPFASAEAAQNRQVITNRLTWRDEADHWTVSLFTFYAPADKDVYLRPSVSYRVDDHWRVSAGMNLFGGEGDTAFFAQFKDNNNAWLRLRYAY